MSVGRSNPTSVVGLTSLRNFPLAENIFTLSSKDEATTKQPFFKRHIPMGPLRLHSGFLTGSFSLDWGTVSSLTAPREPGVLARSSAVAGLLAPPGVWSWPGGMEGASVLRGRREGSAASLEASIFCCLPCTCCSPLWSLFISSCFP